MQNYILACFKRWESIIFLVSHGMSFFKMGEVKKSPIRKKLIGGILSFKKFTDVQYAVGAKIVEFGDLFVPY